MSQSSDRPNSHARVYAPVSRPGAIGKALIVWLASGSIGVALIAFLAFSAMGC